MKPLVSGFTFIKNGLTLGYPIKESIESIEPLCDEIIINVGFDDPNLKEDDGTCEYLKKYFTHEKFKFVYSWWDPKKNVAGEILAEQTNIALKECSGEYCFYIQGDEVIHESDLGTIHDELIQMYRENIEREKNQMPLIEGLVFNYIHFFGNVDVIKYTKNIYRREIRLIKNDPLIQSFKDAQSFRKNDENLSKLLCKQINARVFHYGWARELDVMKTKIKAMDKLFHGDKQKDSSDFDYNNMWGLKRFTDSHPRIMSQWIEQNKNSSDPLELKLKFDLSLIKLAFCDWVESLTGFRIGEFKNFKIVK